MFQPKTWTLIYKYISFIFRCENNMILQNLYENNSNGEGHLCKKIELFYKLKYGMRYFYKIKFISSFLIKYSFLLRALDHSQIALLHSYMQSNGNCHLEGFAYTLSIALSMEKHVPILLTMLTQFHLILLYAC